MIPWSERRFQYTSKQPALYATATLRGPRRTEENVQAWACLDYGRGLWPYGTTWNWASAAGVQGVHPVGLQFGGKWTDGTGMTENALFVAGKIHKIGDTIDFAYDHRDFLKPWTLRSERVDLAFSPFMQNAVRIPLGVVSLDAHVCFGRFFGRVQMDGGDWLAVTSLLGWAEEFRTRW